MYIGDRLRGPIKNLVVGGTVRKQFYPEKSMPGGPNRYACCQCSDKKARTIMLERSVRHGDYREKPAYHHESVWFGISDNSRSNFAP